MTAIFDLRAADGSRHFACLPQTQMWTKVRDHIDSLSGAVLTTFVCDNITEAWIDFTYRDHNFTINDQYGEYWFFVQDPVCPNEILDEVVQHFRLLLNEHGPAARSAPPGRGTLLRQILVAPIVAVAFGVWVLVGKVLGWCGVSTWTVYIREEHHDPEQHA